MAALNAWYRLLFPSTVQPRKHSGMPDGERFNGTRRRLGSEALTSIFFASGRITP
jgi:hypothetical protein